MNHPYPLSEQIKALEHLQEIDLKIDQLKRNKAALPAALKTQDEGLGKIKIQVDAKKNALTEVEKVQRQSRAAIDINNDRLARSMTRLEGIKNSNEFQAVNKEIDQLKKLNGTLDEQIKKAAQDAQTLQTELDQIQASMTKAQEERDAQSALLSSQTGNLDTEIGTLTQERKQFSTKVDPRTLAGYERVRPARGGLGIVPAIGGRCKGCNMMVPPQLFNQVIKCTEIHSCPSCHRILYVPAQPAKTETVGSGS